MHKIASRLSGGRLLRGRVSPTRLRLARPGHRARDLPRENRAYQARLQGPNVRMHELEAYLHEPETVPHKTAADQLRLIKPN